MRLFKYVDPDRIDILTGRRIRFTQASDFNDPFEVAPHVTAILPPGPRPGASREKERRDLEAVLRREAELYGLLPQFQLLQQTILSPQSDFDVFSIIEALGPTLLEAIGPTFGGDFQRWFGERFGILSLSGTSGSLLMWAHYARNHTGLVIEFDADHPFFRQETRSPVLGRLMRVAYPLERPELTAYDASVSPELHIERLVQQLLLSKGREWEYEREWRMILPLTETDRHSHMTIGRVHLFDIPGDAITGVVLGARASPETVNRLREVLESDVELRHVILKQARISHARYELLIE